MGTEHDIQWKLVEELTKLTSAVENMNSELSDLTANFKNGFRKELKNHITNELVQVKENVKTIASPAYQVKFLFGVIGVLATLGGLAALIASFA